MIRRDPFRTIAYRFEREDDSLLARARRRAMQALGVGSDVGASSVRDLSPLEEETIRHELGVDIPAPSRLDRSALEEETLRTELGIGRRPGLDRSALEEETLRHELGGGDDFEIPAPEPAYDASDYAAGLVDEMDARRRSIAAAGEIGPPERVAPRVPVEGSLVERARARTSKISDRLRADVADSMPLEIPEPPSRLDDKPTTRGFISGLSLGYAPGSELGEDASVGDMAQYGVGFLAGSILPSLVGGTAVRLGARGLAAAAPAGSAAARIGQYLSRPVAGSRFAGRAAARDALATGASREAARLAGRQAARRAALQTGAQNVAEGVGFSLLPRKLQEDETRLEQIATDIPLGAALDFPIGVALGRFGGPVRAARAAGDIRRPTPLAADAEPPTVDAEWMFEELPPPLVGPAPPRGEPVTAGRGPRPRMLPGPEGPEGLLTAAPGRSPQVGPGRGPAPRMIPPSAGPLTPPAPEGSLRDPNLVDPVQQLGVAHVRPSAGVTDPDLLAARARAEQTRGFGTGLPAEEPDLVPPPTAPRDEPELPLAPQEMAGAAGESVEEVLESAAPPPPAAVEAARPRFRSAVARAYAEQGLSAENPQEVFGIIANVASDPKTGGERAALLEFLQQRIEELGGVPQRQTRPRGAPPGGPTEPPAAQAAPTGGPDAEEDFEAFVARGRSEHQQRLEARRQQGRGEAAAADPRTNIERQLQAERDEIVGRLDAAEAEIDRIVNSPDREGLVEAAQRRRAIERELDAKTEELRAAREERLAPAPEPESAPEPSAAPGRADADTEAASAPQGGRRFLSDEQRAAIENLPPVPAGHVRLFRGEAEPGEAAIPGWLQEARQDLGVADAEGRWWTDDPEIAGWYVNDAGERGRLVYVDVPEETARSSAVARNPEARRFSADPEREFFLPPEFRGRGQAVGGPARPSLPEAPREVERPPERVEVGERLAGGDGRDTQVVFADNSRVLARYRVVEADELQPSHDPLSFQRNPRYPEEVQGRDYHRDQAAQETVATETARLDPDRMLDPTSMVGAGPPTVTPDGIAVAGNQRAMMLQRAIDHNPEAMAAYREQLIERAAEYGLDPEQIRGMKNPVLVREITDEGLDLASRDVLRELNTRSDLEIGKTKDVLSDAQTRARKLTAGESEALKHLDDTMDVEQTLRSYLSGPSGRRFVSLLIEEGVIGKTEVPKFIDSKTNGVTEEGAQVVQRTLLAAAVGDADVVARAPAGALRKLEHAVPAIVRLSRMPDHSVQAPIREALDLLAEAQTAGLKLNDLLAQGSMFDARDDDPYAVALARFLDGRKPTDVKQAFRTLLSEAQSAQQGTNLFGEEPRSFAEVFRDLFRDEGGFIDRAFFNPLISGTVGGIAGMTAGGMLDDEDPERGMLVGGIAGFVAGAAGAAAILRHIELGEGREVVRRLRDVQTAPVPDWAMHGAPPRRTETRIEGGVTVGPEAPLRAGVRLVDKEPRPLPNLSRFVFDTPAGEIVIDTRYNPDTKTLLIGWVGERQSNLSWEQIRDQIGVAGARQMLATGGKAHPEAEWLAAHRVTGANRGLRNIDLRGRRRQWADEHGAWDPASTRTKELLELLKSAEAETVESGKASSDVLSRLFRRGTSYIERLGESGKQLAEDMRDISVRAKRFAAQMDQDATTTLKGLSREDVQTVAKILNGRKVDVTGEKLRRLTEKAEEVRAILDRVMNEAGKLGFRRRGEPTGALGVGDEAEQLALGAFPLSGSGKAYPQFLNRRGRRVMQEILAKGASSPEGRAMAERMVEEGMALNVDHAIIKIQAYAKKVLSDEVGPSRRLRGMDPYVESTRFEVPAEYIEWDMRKTLPAFFLRQAHTLEGARKWGLHFEKADELVTKLRRDAGADAAEQIARFIKHEFGVPGQVWKSGQRIAGIISNYETAVRLGFSPLSILRNFPQRFVNLAHLPIGAHLDALVHYPPIFRRWIKGAKELEEKVMRSGAVSHSHLVTEMVGNKDRPITDAAMKGFLAVAKGNEVYTAIVAKFAVERDIQRLIELGKAGRVERILRSIATLGSQGEGAVTRRLARSGLSNDQLADILASGRRLSEEEIDAVMQRGVLDTQFPLTLASKRLWWGTNPMIRVLAKFKTFGVEQTGYVYQHVLKEAIKGNVAPLAKFTAAAILGGELYYLVRDTLLGEDRSATKAIARGEDEAGEIAMRLFRDFVSQGGVGMIADLTYGIDEWVGGPALSTWHNLSQGLEHLAERPTPDQAMMVLRDVASREFVAGRQLTGALRRIDNTLTGRNQRYFDYYTWRTRTEGQVRDPEEEGLVARSQELARRVVGGAPGYPVSGRTLSYQYAARAITAGDVDAAATYLARVIRDTPPAERDQTIDAIRTSMRAQSPLRTTNLDRQIEILREYSPAERRAALKLQNEWIADYERALTRALGIASRRR